MSDISSSDGNKLTEPDEEATGEQLPANTDDFDETSPSLSDMPVDIVELIIERSDYKEQLKLRKVSKSLRDLVDKLKPACKSIQVDCSDGKVTIKFDNYIANYTNPVNEYSDEYDDEDEYEEEEEEEEYEETEDDEEEYHDDAEESDDYGEEEEEEDDDFKKVSFNDLASALKNPKLQLEKFSVLINVEEPEVFEKYSKSMQNVWKSLNHQLSVKEFKICVSNPSCLLSILPHLRPGVLEKIGVFLALDWSTNSNGMDQVALLEQWKLAKELELCYSFDEFPMNYATHFKRFIFYERDDVDEDKLIRVKDFLSKLDNFDHCTLACPGFRNRNLVRQLLGAPVSSNTTERVFHHPIPDSDYYLEIKKPKGFAYIKIEKKKREDN